MTNHSALEAVLVGPSGYLMAESITIRNFRCFSETKLSDCRRINVIVGANGSGKTALMEAIFLAVGPSPEIVTRLRRWRGFEVSGLAPISPMLIYRSVWGDLFHDYDFRRPISISLRGYAPHTRQVTINYNERKMISGGAGTAPRASAFSPIQFVWKGINNRTIATSTPRLEGGQMVVDPLPYSPVEGLFFAAVQGYSATEAANRFSELSKRSEEGPIVEFFKQVFTFIEDLSVELHGGTPMIFAKVDGMADRIPIGLVSGGLNKLASIITMFPNYPQGIALIDEIENGFYYKTLPKVWEALLHFGKLHDLQVFASTHSLECLKAAAEVANTDPESFSLLRVVRGNKGSIVREFAGADFASAIFDDVEVR